MGSYFKSAILSVALHAAAILALALSGVVGGCRLRRQKPEIVEFTIAVDPVAEEEPEPEAPRPPDAAPPPPPAPDDIAVEKPREPPKKPKEQSQPRPQPKPIVKGKRVRRPVNNTVAPRERQTLSDAEIQKWLNRRARIGETTSLPKNEASLNASILMNRFYDAWNPPPREASGTRPAVVVFGIGRDGTLLSPRIETSSGSAAYDASCLEAVRRVGCVPELSAAFIAEYGPSCPVEFKQKE